MPRIAQRVQSLHPNSCHSQAKAISVGNKTSLGLKQICKEVKNIRSQREQVGPNDGAGDMTLP